MKSTLLLIATLVLTSVVSAQEVSSIPNKEIGISIGLRSWKIKEQRFSNRIKQTQLLNFGMFHMKQTDASRVFFSGRFAFNMNPKKGAGIRYGIINPDLKFSYQRKVNQIWLGPSLSHQTLVNLPMNTQGMFNNNPVSYTGVTSLGLAGDYIRSFDNSAFDLTAGFDYALLGHIIRPAYAHPYPEDFLREEVFDPTREGIAKSVARSGKMKTLNGFQSLKVSIGISYHLGSKFKVGLLYERQFLSVTEDKSLAASAQDLSLTISHLY